MDDREPHFIIQHELRVCRLHPQLLSFRILSKRQPHSNREKWYMSVAEMMEETAHESPVYFLQAKHAVALARNLLNAVGDSEKACASSADGGPLLPGRG